MHFTQYFHGFEARLKIASKESNDTFIQHLINILTFSINKSFRQFCLEVPKNSLLKQLNPILLIFIYCGLHYSVATAVTVAQPVPKAHKSEWTALQTENEKRALALKKAKELEEKQGLKLGLGFRHSYIFIR